MMVTFGCCLVRTDLYGTFCKKTESIWLGSKKVLLICLKKVSNEKNTKCFCFVMHKPIMSESLIANIFETKRDNQILFSVSERAKGAE